MTAPARPFPRWMPDGYPLVLLVLVLSIVAAALGTRDTGMVGSSIVVVALWLATARAVGVHAGLRLGGVVAGLVLTASAASAYSRDSANLRAAISFATALATLAVALLIGQALLHERVVSLHTIAGLVSLYLLIGLIFAATYLGCAELSPSAFSGITPVRRFDLVYFSFVTMTTVGFGDITATVDATRALAAGEAVTGQLFLVTVVARAVSLLRRPDGSAPPAP